MRKDRGMQRVHLRTRYRQILLVIGIALLAASTWWMLNGGDRGTTYAVVLTFTVAVLTLVRWPRTFTGC